MRRLPGLGEDMIAIDVQMERKYHAVLLGEISTVENGNEQNCTAILVTLRNIKCKFFAIHIYYLWWIYYMCLIQIEYMYSKEFAFNIS
jgi:hypothetical protein